MENIVFEQSILGFNRHQVLDYIDTLVKQLKEQEIQYTQTQQDLQQEVEGLMQRCNDNREDLSLAVEKIKELSDEVEYFKKNNFELKNQIDHYKNLILHKDKEVIDLKKDNLSLRTKTDLLVAENENWKKRQDKIGECLVNASLEAENIIRSAQQEAQQTKKSMEEQTEKLSQDVLNLKEEIIRVESQLEQSFQKLQTAMVTMDSSAYSIEQQVAQYRNNVQEIDIEEIFAAEPSTRSGRMPTSGYAAVKGVKPVKKSLTDSVLDTITKLLEK